MLGRRLLLTNILSLAFLADSIRLRASSIEQTFFKSESSLSASAPSSTGVASIGLAMLLCLLGFRTLRESYW